MLTRRMRRNSSWTFTVTSRRNFRASGHDEEAPLGPTSLGGALRGRDQNHFDIGKGGMEYALTQLLISVAFLLTGPGEYSLGRWLPVPLQKF